MQIQGFPLQENSPTGMQSRTYSKGVFYHYTSVGRNYGHMYQVPNPTLPTKNCRSSLSMSCYSKLLKCGDSKTIPSCPSLVLFRNRSIAPFPKILVTVESYSFLFCLCIRLIITNHCGYIDINQLNVCPASDVENFKVLLHFSRHASRETMSLLSYVLLKGLPSPYTHFLYISISVSRERQCISSSRSQLMSVHSVYWNPFQRRIIQCSGCKFQQCTYVLSSEIFSIYPQPNTLSILLPLYNLASKTHP